jgi:hypothetical protein
MLCVAVGTPWGHHPKEVRSMSNGKTFLIGRDARTGQLMPVKDARNRPATTVVERMPKRGNGDSAPKKKG